MPGANEKVSIVVDIQGKIDNIQNAIKQVQNSFANIKFTNGAEQNLLSNIKSISRELDGIKKRAAGGLTGGQLSSDLKKLETYGRELNNILKFTDKVKGNPIKFLDTDTFSTLRNINGELTKFANQLEKAKSSKFDLNGDLERANSALTQAQEKLKDFKEQHEINIDFNSAKELSNYIKNLQDSIKGLDKDDVIRIGKQGEIDRLKALQEQFKSMTTEVTNAQTKVDTIETKLKELGNVNIDNFIAKIKELHGIELKGESIEQLRQNLLSLSTKELEKIAPLLQTIDTSAMEANNGVASMADAFRDAGNSAKYMQQVNQEMNQLANRLTYFFSAASMVNVFVRSLRNAFGVIKELDKAMTETAVVTNYTVADMWKQLPKYTQTANELGATTKGAYETMTLFFQQGLDQVQAFQLGTETMKMARIAGLEYAEATDRMTNALRGFNMELNDTSSQRVNDVYSNLAAKSASNVDELSTAMTKTASIAHAANMEFETTAAFLAQIIETTRESAETAGTALKTVIARFSEVKKLYSEGELTGTDSEGEEIDVNRVSTALRAAGVDLNEYLTGAKGLDEVFIELASKWDNLDLVTQRYIATMAAGSRQQSRFIALMQDYGRQTELVSIAENSAGASQEQFQKTLDSLEAKLNQLSNAWNEFTMHLMDSSFLKGIIDGITNLIEGINKLIDATGGFGVALAGLGTILGARFVASLVGRFANTLKTSFAASGTMAGQAFGKALDSQVTSYSLKAKVAAKQMYNSFNQEFVASRKKNNGNVLLGDVSKQAQQFKNQLKSSEFADVKNTLTGIFQGGINEAFKKLDFSQAGEAEHIFNKYGDEIGRQIASGMGSGLSEDEAINTAFEKVLGKNLNGAANYVKTKVKESGISKMVASEAGIQKLGEGMQTVSTGAMAAANAINGVANQLDQLGLHSTAAALRTLGGLLQTFGAIATAVGFMVQKAGAIASSTWFPLVLVIGAVVAAIAIFNAISWNNSLEKQAEDLTTAFKATEQAAKDAKQAYDDALGNKSKYTEITDTMDQLVKGTAEWVQQLLEANEIILDIIAKNPELAPFMTTNVDTGALELTAEGWDKYIKDMQDAANRASFAQLSTQGALNTVNGDIARKNFFEQNYTTKSAQRSQDAVDTAVAMGTGGQAISALTTGLGEYIYNGLKDGSIESVDDVINQLEGSYLFGEDAQDEIVELMGEANRLLAEENATLTENEALYQQAFSQAFEGNEKLAASIAHLAAGKTSADIKTSAKKYYQEFTTTDDSERAKLAERYKIQDFNKVAGDETKELRAIYAGLFNIDVDDISEDIKDNKDALANAIAEFVSGDDLAKGVQDALNKMKSKKLSDTFSEALIGILDGAELTSEQVQALELKGIDLENIDIDSIAEVSGITPEEWADILGLDGVEGVTEAFEKGAQEALEAKSLVADNLSRSIVDGINSTDWKAISSAMSFQAQNNLTDKLAEAENRTGDTSAGDQILGVISKFVQNLPSKDKTKALETLTATNWDNLDELEDLPNVFKQIGITTPGIENVTDAIARLNKAAHNVTLDNVTDKLKTLQETINTVEEKVKNGETTFTGEEKAQLEKQGIDATSFVRTGIDEWTAVNISGNEILSTISGNVESILGELKGNLEEDVARGEAIKQFLTEENERGQNSRLADYDAENIIGSLIHGGLTAANFQTDSDRALLERYATNVGGVNAENVDQYSIQALIDAITTGFEQYYGEQGSALAANQGKLDTYNQEYGQLQYSSMASGQDIINAQPLNSEDVKNRADALEGLIAKEQGLAEAVKNSEKELQKEGTFFGNNSKEVAEQRKQVQALTIDYAKNAKEIDKLNDVIKDQSEALKDQDKNSDAYRKALSDVASAASQAFNSNVTTDFVNENLELFQQLEEGGEKAQQAFDQIGQKIANEYAESIRQGITQTQEFSNIIDEINEKDVEIGGTADFSQIFNELASLMGSAQAAAQYLESLGYTVDWEIVGYKRIKVETLSNSGWSNGKGYEELREPIFKSIVKKNSASGSGPSRPKGGGGGGGGGGGSKDKEPEDNRDWKNPYDKLYNEYAKLEELQRKRNNLEKEFALTVDTAAGSVAKTTQQFKEQLKNLQAQADTQEKIVSGKKSQIANAQNKTYSVEDHVVKSYATAFKDAIDESNKTHGTSFSSNLADYAKYNTSTGQMEIDWNQIQSLEGQIDSAAGEVLEAYVSELEGLEDQLEEAQDGLIDIKTEIKTLVDQAMEDRIAYVDAMREAMISQYQKQIDKLSALNDAINESNQRIFDSLQQQIDLERQIRDNTKTEDEIAQNEARLAYLQRDTSGANDLEIQKLQQTLADQRENYSDTLVDQELARLQDQADEAAEQREHQIELMEAQLQFWQDTGYFEELIDKGISEGKAMEIYKDYTDYANKTRAEQAKIMQDFYGLFNKGGSANTAALAAADAQYNGGKYKVKDSKGNTYDVSYDAGTGTWKGKGANGQAFSLTAEQITSADTNKKILSTSVNLSQTSSSSGASSGSGGGGGGNSSAKTEPAAPSFPYGKASDTTGNIKKGAKGNAVKAIQYALNKLGYGNSGTKSLDGVFGSGTANAVKAFQKAMGISADGIVGKNTRAKFKAKGYSTGGLADYTGPAWLHGSPSKPELVLNAKDTENFIQLKNILADVAKDSKSGSSGGDNYFDIKVEVGEIGSDYDVEKMITKIKDEIDQDARYRNVNSINFIR